ncbi:MAG: hypothetical protein AAGA85_22710 [Bacteroidota bacterium]
MRIAERKTKRLSQLWMALVAFSVFLTSCSDGDEPGLGGGIDEIETAIAYGFRTETETNSIYYLGVYSDFVDELDVEDAVELGPNQRVYFFGEHPYTWSGDASTITKWNVDKSNLSITQDETVSFAAEGVSGNLGEPVFFSESRAFFFALVEGKIIELDPANMTITTTINVDPVVFEGHVNGAWYDAWIKYTLGDKIYLPVGFIAGSEWALPNGAEMAIFDPSTNAITYHLDTRLQAGQYWLPSSDDGRAYVIPGWDLDAEVHYSGAIDALPTQNILRLNSDGSFDQNWAFDMNASLSTLGNPLAVYDVLTVANNVAVILWREGDEWPTDPADRYNDYFDQIRFAAVNLETGDASPFTAWSNYESVATANELKPLDGVNYFIASQPENNEEILLRQNGFDNYTEVTKLTGGSIRTAARLW